MSDKNSVKLRVLSEIDDGILEKNSILRAKLFRKPKMNRKMLVSIYAAAACLLLIGGSLLALISLLTKQVPIYQGMTVSQSTPVSVMHDLPDSPTYLSVATPPLLRGPKEDREEKEKKEKLKDAVRDTLDIKAADSMYYAKPGEDVYVTVHISNPDDFEILSFTLNGKKYSSYMFEEGSNMENIIIKVNVGEATGISEYTIDAIKYVDGAEIKDVRMDGERTVRIGIYTENQPTVKVTGETISYDSLSFEVIVLDPEELIQESGGKAIALLYNGEEIVEYVELPIGEATAVSFEGLKPNTEYQYAVTIAYDALDGKGFDTYVLVRKDFDTYSALTFENLQVTQTEVYFVPTWNAQVKEKELLSLALYQNGTLVKNLSFDINKVDGLLSNTAYELVAEILVDGVRERATLNFTTQAKAAPQIAVADGELSQNGFQFIFDDPDGVGSVTKIELLKNGSVIQAPSDLAMRQFEGLTANTLYQLKVAYVYDLNDGKGTQSKEVTLSVATLPQAIEISQITTVGATLVTPGESVFLRVQLNNPDGVEIKSIEIGGKTLQLLKVGSYYECVYQVVSTGGKENIAITGISFVSVNGKTVVQATDYTNDSLLMVAGYVTVESFTVDEFIYTNDNIVATIVFKGSEPYEIVSIFCDVYDGIYGNYDRNFNREITLTKVSDTVYTAKMPWASHSLSVHLSIKALKFKGGVKQEIEQDAEKHQTVYVCMPFGETSLELCTPISTPEQLQNMKPYGCYKLVNDIDLSGFQWEPYALQYVYLDGNGYAIKNFAYSSRAEYEVVGMFISVSHCQFKNVVLENASILLWEKPLYCGIFAGCASSTIFEDCRIEGNIRCGENAKEASCGGFVGRYFSELGGVIDGGVSELVCYDCIYSTNIKTQTFFSNCEFKGTIVGAKSAYAFVATSKVILVNCNGYAGLPLCVKGTSSVLIDSNTYPYEP